MVDWSVVNEADSFYDNYWVVCQLWYWVMVLVTVLILVWGGIEHNFSHLFGHNVSRFSIARQMIPG